MGLTSLIVSVFLLIFSLIINKKLISPLNLFYLLWTFILLLSNLSLYNIKKPSDDAYILIILMLISFFIGSIMVNKINRRKEIEQKYNEVNANFKIIYILYILLFAFTLIDVYIIVSNLIKGIPLASMRRWHMGVYGVDTNPILARRTFLEEIFRNVVLGPFGTLIPPLTAYVFLSPKKYKNRYLLLILSILNLLLSSVAGGGGRLGYIYYFGCFLLAYIVFSKTNEQFNKKLFKKVIFALMILGLTITIIFTNLRSSSSFIAETYKYFALPPTLLSEWLPKLSSNTLTYGMTTFFGIHSYIFRGFEAIGFNFLIPEIYDISYQNILNAENFLFVGSGHYNAFVTPIYYFCADGGWIFVIIASVLFGFLSQKIYHNLIKNINLKSFMLYALVMYGVFLTFIRIQTAIPSYIISFIMILFIFRKSKKGEVE